MSSIQSKFSLYSICLTDSRGPKLLWDEIKYLQGLVVVQLNIMKDIFMTYLSMTYNSIRNIPYR